VLSSLAHTIQIKQSKSNRANQTEQIKQSFHVKLKANRNDQNVANESFHFKKYVFKI
jgi:hypothetical protein